MVRGGYCYLLVGSAAPKMIPEEIERVALLGWAVFPAARDSRAMSFAGADKLATTDLNQIETWCKRFSNCNWRVAFGASGLWGFDLDTPPIHAADGIKALASLVKVHGPLPARPQARSGGGGLAVYFQHRGEAIIGATGTPLPGMDPRRGAQTQTIPPSIHVDTKQPYRWITAPWEVAPPIAPGWLMRLVEPPPPPPTRPAPDLKSGTARRNYAVAALHNATRRVAAAGEGHRNDTLNGQCWALAKFLPDGSLTEAEIRDCMVAAARACGTPIREACLTIDSALRSKRK
jgi:hypothetical protein